MNEQRYPLFWPVGWKRTSIKCKSRFGHHTVYDSRMQLECELGRMDAKNIVLSTNLELRRDGLPYSDNRGLPDAGVAVYFTHKNKRLVLACDQYPQIADNIWAIKCHVEAMRAQERYGVGSVEQAFAGYAALPMHGMKRQWHEILGCSPNADAALVARLYRDAALQAHPDRGGSHERMAELNAAYNEFQNGGTRPLHEIHP